MVQDTKFHKTNSRTKTNSRRTFSGAPVLAALALSLAGGLLTGPAAHAGGTTVVVVHSGTPVALPSHIIWGSIRRQSSGIIPAAVQSAKAAPAPLHVAWVQVRLYQDGSYQVEPAGDGMSESDDDFDDDAMVELVPILVGA